MLKRAAQFWANEAGATAIEYSIILSLIALAIITGVSSIAPHLNNTFNAAGNKLQ